jgi:amidase
MTKIVYESATRLAQAIRTRSLSSSEVVSAHLEQIEKENHRLNAVVQIAADVARVQAKEADQAIARGHNWGPLHGVPVTIKDGWETKGIISSAGTAGRASFVPEEDATVVARVRAAGAIVLGKTNVPELSLSNETDNSVYGRTNNPYDLSRTPGGSGGGQAAIIAVGGSPLDIGCDAGGSIRLPSHFCGIAGIKPTTG